MASAPDVIWLNGAFGVGKTTVSERVEDAAVLDAELIGTMLRVLLPTEWQTEDWQDLALWRRLTRETIAGLVADGRRLIVPMTVMRPAYLGETVDALRAEGVDVRHFTLVAGSETVVARLVARGGERNQWARDRATECVEALADPCFAEHVDADQRGSSDVAREIVDRVAA